MSADLGACWQRANTCTSYVSPFVLWKTDCYSSYSSALLQKKPCSFTSPGRLLWMLTNVPSLIASKVKIPIIWRQVGKDSSGYFCLYYLRILCLKQQKTNSFSYRKAKEKNSTKMRKIQYA